MHSAFLDKMKLCTQKRVASSPLSLVELKTAALLARKPHDFLTRFMNDPLPRIIAEVKFASPALGEIAKGQPVEIAKQYIENGASAISVLTEPDYFKGSLDYLSQVREALPDALLLMKDFVLDELQLLQARVYGADAVLLIVAFLELDVLQSLYNKSLALGLTPLVEVHTKDELLIAQSLGAKLIGVNNRNLQTLKIDLQTSTQLMQDANKYAILISESGIQDSSDILALQQIGFQGFLIGGKFMQDQNPGQALNFMISQTRYV